MGCTAGSNQNPTESKAEMFPEALVACPSLCRMKTDPERGLVFRRGRTLPASDISPPTSLLPHVPQAPYRVLEPPWKGGPFALSVGASRINCLGERDVGSGSRTATCPGCWILMGAAVYLSHKDLPRLRDVCGDNTVFCPQTGNGQMTIPGNRIYYIYLNNLVTEIANFLSLKRKLKINKQTKISLESVFSC